MIPIALLVAIISFFLIHLSPGDPATFFVSPDAPVEEYERMRERLGVDQPVPVQFVRWIGGVVQGDLGVSFFQRRPVVVAYFAALPVTLMLAAGGIIVALTLALPIGIYSALKPNSLGDKIATAFVFTGISMPNFWFGMLLILLFAVNLGWLPAQGFLRDAGLVGNLRSLILPALALGYPNSALIARMTRSSMLEVLRQDYVRTARAKGLRSLVVMSKHAFLNAINPILTVIGLVFARMIAGSVVIETVFNLPGVGRLVVNSVMRRDYPVIQGSLLLTAMLIIGVNLVIDLLYAVFDPRIRYD
jgi:peptide/nickel transport system permease protein